MDETETLRQRVRELHSLVTLAYSEGWMTHLDIPEEEMLPKDWSNLEEAWRGSEARAALAADDAAEPQS